MVVVLAGLPELDTRERAILIKLGPWQPDVRKDLGREGYGFPNEGPFYDRLYDSTRGIWRLSIERAKSYSYAVTVHAGRTWAVWEIDPQQ